jgi:hypothetical protein
MPVVLLIGASNVHAQVQEKWSRVYFGPGDNVDEAVGIGLDASGNCYVAGNSTGSADWDFLVAKYNDSGAVEWEHSLNGPGDSSDYAMALEVDGDGNSFVGGWTTTKGVSGGQTLLIKLNTAGGVVWTCKTKVSDANVRDLFIGPSHDIIAVGMGSQGGYNAYATKYSPAGDSLWTKYYKWTGSSGGDGKCGACALDGSVYLAGFVGYGTPVDILTVKMSADGDTLWGRAYDGPGHGSDAANGIAVDNDGNAYVVGKIIGSGGSSDIVVLKYSPAGELLWDWIYDGSASGTDAPVGVLIDPDGNVCIGGYTRQSETSDDFTFIKLSPDGDSLLFGYAGTAASESAEGVALDSAGNMYITGRRASYTGTLDDYLTMKFDGATGANLWEMTWDGGGGYDLGTHVCIGQEDHVYVAGYVNGTDLPDTENDIGVVAYEPVVSAVFEQSVNNRPRGFALHQNSPNPFNAATTIRFDVERGGAAALSILNLLGQTILTHREDNLLAGSYSFEWDGTDMKGRSVASGVYFYRLTAEQQSLTRKMVLMK